MHTVFMHYDHNEWLDIHRHAYYVQGKTYFNVPEDVANRIVKAGLGEIMDNAKPDDHQDHLDYNDYDPSDYVPEIEKPKRRKVSKKW